MTDSAALPPDDENHIIAERREKLRQWREAGGAYPNDFHRTHYAGEITAQHTATPAETLDAQPEHVHGGRPHDAQAGHGQGQLRHDSGHVGPHPALHAVQRRRGR
jgi:lysyl-tRNA synthetase class II